MAEHALLNPIRIGPYNLTNRVFMAPMTRNRADNPENAPTELHAEYYSQRASAGLIITEGSQVSKQGVGYINTPGIHSRAQIEGWKLVTRAVHDKGGRIFIQIWHCGRISHPDFHGGELPVAPSAINPHDRSYTPQGFKETVTPRALTIDEIHAVTRDFVQAAANAMEAGFDGVEIHSANGYLFHQFFTNCSNTRTDEYGGSHENRARFFFETLDAVGKAIGFAKTGIRLNPSANGFFGITIDKDTIPTFEHIVERLNDYKDLAYIHLTEPMLPVDDVPYAVSRIARHFRPRYRGVLMTNCGYNHESGRRVIEEGLADAVSYAKYYIANPDLVDRIRRGAPLAEPDTHTYYTPGPKGYTDYPTLG
ncbi:MAG TPA: alkene reductase [Desulfomonilia bacterium]|nr:alkene reductase [Desulfomonilia bacterium]